MKHRKKESVPGYLGDFLASSATTLVNPVLFSTFCRCKERILVGDESNDATSKNRFTETLSFWITKGSAWSLMVIGSVVFGTAFV